MTLSAAPDTGDTGLSLQWYLNGQALVGGPTGHGSTIVGAHSEVLNLPSFRAPDVGNDTLLVTTLTGPVVVGDGHASHATMVEAIAPNPLRGTTQLSFSLAHGVQVRLRVLDLSGRTVRALESRTLLAGQHAIACDARSDDDSTAQPGMYNMAFEVDGKRLAGQTLVIVR